MATKIKNISVLYDAEDIAQGCKKNYLLGLDLMTLLQKDNLPKVGKTYQGMLIMTDDYSAKFVEKVSSKATKRNCRVYSGDHITMTYRLQDEHIRLNFKEVLFTPGFDVDTYAIEVMEEIRSALKSFVEESLD